MRGRFCSLQLPLALARTVILRSDSRETAGHILLSQNRDSTNLEGQVPVFISPRKRVAQLYPQALCSLFVASYDSRGYGGGIRPRLHKGVCLVMAAGPRYITSARIAQKKTPIPTVTSMLHSRCLVNDCFSGYTILALSKYATVL
jgi:hypothetical protein